MRAIITGGGGFVGHRLVKALLARGHVTDSTDRQVELEKLTVVDVAPSGYPVPDDRRLEMAIGDVADADFVADLISDDVAALWHLAAVVSGGAEADFDRGMRANLHGTQLLLERCRSLGTMPRFVFASTVAVYGGDLPAVVDEGTALNPQTSYGMQKAIGEMLINDYSRRGFIDGRALRLPTIVVRAGSANTAVTSFASDIIREPLQGRQVNCPVAPDTALWILSARRVVECLLHAEQIPALAWGPSRVVALPGLRVIVAEIVEALRRVAGDAAADRITWLRDPFIAEVVSGFPTRFDTTRAQRLGFPADAAVDEVIEAFIEDELQGAVDP